MRLTTRSIHADVTRWTATCDRVGQSKGEVAMAPIMDTYAVVFVNDSTSTQYTVVLMKQLGLLGTCRSESQFHPNSRDRHIGGPCAVGLGKGAVHAQCNWQTWLPSRHRTIPSQRPGRCSPRRLSSSFIVPKALLRLVRSLVTCPVRRASAAQAHRPIAYTQLPKYSCPYLYQVPSQTQTQTTFAELLV